MMADIKLSIVLLAYLLIAPFSVTDARAKSFQEILDALEYPNKLLFDISSSVYKEIEHNPDIICGGLFNARGIKLSPIIFYTRDMKMNESSIHDDLKFRYSYNSMPSVQLDYDAVDPFYQFSIMARYTSVSVMFSWNDTNSTLPLPIETHTSLELLKNPPVLHDEHLTVIFQYRICDRSVSGCVNTLRQLHNTISYFKRRRSWVKVGIQYNFQENILEPDLEFTAVLKIVDVVVVEYEIPVSEFALTYPKFKLLMKKKLSQSQNFVRLENPNCEVFMKLSIFDETYSFLNSLLLSVFHGYYFYMLQYIVNWINEEGNEGGYIILESFRNLMANVTGLDGPDVGDIVIPEMDGEYQYDVMPGSCEMKTVLEKVGSQFRRVVADGVEFSNKLKNINPCVITNGENCTVDQRENILCNRPSESSLLPELHLHTDNIGSFSRSFIAMQNNLKELSVKLLEIDMQAVPLSKLGSMRIGNEIKLRLQNLNMTLACGSGFPKLKNGKRFTADAILASMQQTCNVIWSNSQVITSDLRLHFGKSIVDFSLNLWAVVAVYRQFLQKYPGKNAILNIKFEGIKENSHGQDGGLSSTLYCNDMALEQNTMIEYVVNFARIHRLPIRIKPVLDKGEQVGWWSPLKTLIQIDKMATKFPVFVARNYPEKHMMGDFHVDPCLDIGELPVDKIKFDRNYAGATIYMGKIRQTPISTEELHVLLLFALHRFSQIEIIPGSISDLKTAFHLLSQQHFVIQLQQEGRSDFKIYLGLDWELIGKQEEDYEELFGIVAKLILRPAGFHFFKWENSSYTAVKNVLQILTEEKVKVGLGSDSCIAEVNRRFENLRKFNVSNIDYLFCVMENVVVNSEAETQLIAREMGMEMYLDTQLYIQKYFERMFSGLNTEVLFRRDYLESWCHDRNSTVEKEKTEGMLIFMSDVANYVSAYKLKTFMISAFNGGGHCGWWKLLNAEELKNTSSYIEQESAYHKRSPWKPTPIFKESTSIWTEATLVTIGLGGVLILIVGAALPYLVRRLGLIRLLTKKEEDDFLHGSNNSEGGHLEAFEKLKFPNEFKLQLGSFTLLNIMGKGNFGLVYNATVSLDDETIPCAVKLPQSNCSKEAFKCMLSELKMLSYLGDHIHVVGFIGAYINEIAKGFAYIATELCERGNLKDYLLDLATDFESGRHGKVDVYELCRFSQEIAMGMEYISERKVIHGDLSSRNVFLNVDLQCKIGDFGLSRKLYEYEEYVKKKGEPLPWRWLALESLKTMTFTTKSDVWSYGVTLWEVFSLGSVPHAGLSWNADFIEKLENGLKLSVPQHTSQIIYDKLVQCCNIDQDERPSFAELVEFFEAQRNLDYGMCSGGKT